MFTTNSEGAELFYDVRGEGEPLVLLPGAGQSHIALFDTGLVDLFAAHYQVILLDFTGLGHSARVTSMRPEQWAQDVISVMDAVGVERAHLGGSSLGARVGARVAAEFNERVRTLLVDMPITGVDQAQEARLHELFSAYRTNMLSERAPRWHGETWTEAMDFFIATRQTREFREYYSPVNYLAEIQAPTLLCRGDRDNPVHPISQTTDWHCGAQTSWLWLEPGASSDALTTACPDRVVSTFVRFTAAMSEHAVVS